MTYYAYLFELKGIQSFLFATGKLRDMVSGSELVDFLCTTPLDEVLALAMGEESLNDLPQTKNYKIVCNSLSGDQNILFCPRKAGGAFYLVFDDFDKRARFSSCWRLLINQVLPNTEQAEVLPEGQCSIKAALKEGINQLASSRQRLPALPFASPLTLRAPRTGYAAVAKDKNDKEWLDVATRNKRRFVRPPALQQSIVEQPLTKRFCEDASLKWPNTFENDDSGILFPLNNHNIAIVHADGNGLGEVLRALNAASAAADDETYVKLYRQFSDELAVTTITSAQEATEQAIVPFAEKNILPLRPVVLGGDDLTVIIREDLALNFTRIFCEQFEKNSKSMLARLRDSLEKSGIAKPLLDKLPSMLTACAGISFIKPSQPFAQAYELTEELCKRAKKSSKNCKLNTDIPSSIAFIRLQDSLIESLEQITQREMHVSIPEGTVLLGLNAYGVGEVPSTLPSLKTLQKLQRLFKTSSESDLQALNSSRLRGVCTLLHQDVNSAMRDYKRWIEVSNNENIDLYHVLLAEILGGELAQPYSFAKQNEGKIYQSPIIDLLCLLFSEKPAQGERDE